MSDLREYELLLNGSDPDWVLLKVGEAREPQRYLAYHAVGRYALVIEDEDLAARVHELMKEWGVRVLDAAGL